MIELRYGDCLKHMPSIPDGSIDAIIADPPYGSTNLPWDQRIDPEAMWREFRRVIKPKGAIVLFADFRFALELVQAAPRRWFRYYLIWAKANPVGFLNANRQPLRLHELILVFASGQTTYHSQFKQGIPYVTKQKSGQASHYGKHRREATVCNKGTRFPTSILEYPRPVKGFHPTAKPLGLITQLVKTYTNEGETVLDPTMGAGTTGVACVANGRHFLGIEKDYEIYQTAGNRIELAQNIFATHEERHAYYSKI